MVSIKDETISGVKWQLIQRLTMQPLNFFYSILIARFLLPEDFGILALTSIFFAIAYQLCDGGFSTALIRKIDRTKEDINTVYWYNVAMTFCMSAIIWACAPLFAVLFDKPILITITRISACTMFLSSWGGVHRTLYVCRKDFKSLAIFGMISSICSMPICLILAWKGYGYWALIVQSVVQSVLSLAILLFKSPWQPSLVFAKQSFKEFFAFGNRLVLNGIIDVFYNHSKNLLIGKFYSPNQLGLFNRAHSLSSTPSGVVNGILGSITLPILATIQEDEARLFDIYRRYIRLTSMLIFFIGFLFFAQAKPIINILYGENWNACVHYAQILVLGVMTFHYGTINNNLLIVKGRSDLLLKAGLLKKFISFALLIPALFISIEAVCWVSFAFFPVSIVVNSHYTRKLFGLTARRQLSDFLPYFFRSALCCAPSFFICMTDLAYWKMLAISTPLSLVLYYLILSMCNDSALKETLQIIQERGYIKKLKKLLLRK